MRGPATPPHCATTAMEQHQLDVVLFGHRHQLLLRLVQRPRGRQPAGILAAVAVACTGAGKDVHSGA